METKANISKVGISRRDFIYRGSAGAIALPLIPAGTFLNSATPKGSPANPTEQIWRNRQPDMAYRQLGRTGFMVSEIVYGGNRVNPDNIRFAEIAIEKGLNYIDTSPGYQRGESEIAFGKLLANPGMRDKVFLTTKITPFSPLRNRLYKEIYDGLPSSKQVAINKKAMEMRKERGVDNPEYFVMYFGPSQKGQIDESYLCNAMMKEYGEKVEGSPEFEKLIIETLEASLKRLQTDHIDILMCPHGCSSPEDLQNPYIIRTFEKLKKQGKVSHLGLSAHNDVAGVLRAAMETSHYDVIMLAYNIINHGYVDSTIREAHANGMGIIAMKAANPLSPPNNNTAPAWRLEKLNHFVPGDMHPAVKGYIWVLQNPCIAAAVSEMFTEEVVRENLTIPGRKIEELPA